MDHVAPLAKEDVCDKLLTHAGDHLCVMKLHVVQMVSLIRMINLSGRPTIALFLTVFFIDVDTKTVKFNRKKKKVDKN